MARDASMGTLGEEGYIRKNQETQDNQGCVSARKRKGRLVHSSVARHVRKFYIGLSMRVGLVRDACETFARVGALQCVTWDTACRGVSCGV